MIKRIVYTSTLFKTVFWMGLLVLAIPLASRIVTGWWQIDEHNNPTVFVAAVVTIGLWIIILVMLRDIHRYYENQKK